MTKTDEDEYFQRVGDGVNPTATTFSSHPFRAEAPKARASRVFRMAA